MSKRLLVIANLEAGQPENAIQKIQESLASYQVSYQLETVKTPGQAYNLATKLDPSKLDAVAVYGGDGTVVAVYKAVYGKKIPVLILPGGTANALARDLGLTGLGVEGILRMYAEDRYILRYVDVALANGRPLVLDLHFGAWTEAITQTQASHKRRFGKLAYYWTASRVATQLEPQDYGLQVDGRPINARAYALVVANGGFQNILGVPFFPYVHGRGTLQVALIRRTKPWHIWRWLVLRAVFGWADETIITTYRAKHVVIQQAPGEMIFDDSPAAVKLPLDITVAAEPVMTVAPAVPTSQWWVQLWLKLQLLFVRLTDHLSRWVTGQPVLGTSHVAPGLYLGGQYRLGALRLMQSWGVTGVVNMRMHSLLQMPPAIEHLHLPTPDWTPPSLEALAQGVTFIDRHIKAGGSVYVHCRQGEGRGPSMAAAYLISKGMRVEDALAHLRRYRPFARPNAIQVRQLARFQEQQAQVRAGQAAEVAGPADPKLEPPSKKNL